MNDSRDKSQIYATAKITAETCKEYLDEYLAGRMKIETLSIVLRRVAIIFERLDKSMKGD